VRLYVIFGVPATIAATAALLCSPLSTENDHYNLHFNCFCLFPNQLSPPSVTRFSQNFSTPHDIASLAIESVVRIFDVPLKEIRRQNPIFPNFSGTASKFCDDVPQSEEI